MITDSVERNFVSFRNTSANPSLLKSDALPARITAAFTGRVLFTRERKIILFFADAARTYELSRMSVRQRASIYKSIQYFGK